MTAATVEDSSMRTIRCNLVMLGLFLSKPRGYWRRSTLTDRKAGICITLLPVLAVLLALIVGCSADDGGPISAARAKANVGSTQTVCGLAASATYARSSSGRPTFINLGKPYPDHSLTIVIWGHNREKFSTPPERAYVNQQVCVTGLIESYRDSPQIVVATPSQITRADNDKRDVVPYGRQYSSEQPTTASVQDVDVPTNSPTPSPTSLINSLPTPTQQSIVSTKPQHTATPRPTQTLVPTPLPVSAVFLQVTAGDWHSCGVRSSGKVVCWGSNEDFPLGPDYVVDFDNGRFVGQSAPPDGIFHQIDAGAAYTCGVKTNGNVECWGSNDEGQARPPKGPFLQVSSGGDHTCGLMTNGEIECWGSDEEGQSSPQPGVYRQVAAGGKHTCGLKADGRVVCWGKNNRGQADPPSGSFQQISANFEHTCGVKNDGQLSCWGSNRFATGEFTGQSMPPSGIFSQVSTGDYHSCAVRSDKRVVCWGTDYLGQSSSPTDLFRQVDAGTAHTCGVTTTNQFVCWGFNEIGQVVPPGGSVKAAKYGTLAYASTKDVLTLAPTPTRISTLSPTPTPHPTLAPNTRCKPGEHWVSGNYRRGTWVRGHYRGGTWVNGYCRSN